MTASLRYQYRTSRYIYKKVDGIRVRFDILEACGMSSKVFAYLMGTLNPNTRETIAHFSHVCSPVDLEEYPEDAPNPDVIGKYFRLPYVDVFLSSVHEADGFVDGVIADLRRLKRTLEVFETLSPGGDMWIGENTCDTPSASASSSDSSGGDSAGDVIEMYASIGGGTYEHGYGLGEPWVDVREGAGTPEAGQSESEYQGIGDAFTRVELRSSQYSQLLGVQGYELDDIPANAVLRGVGCRITFRYSEGPTAVPPFAMVALMHPAVGLSANRASVANGSAIVVDPTNRVVQAEVDVPATTLWGLSLTTRLIKQGDFGVVLTFAPDAARDLVVIDVDGVELFVRYEVPDA